MAQADNTGYFYKTNNPHSVTMPDGNIFSFLVHDYFRFSSRATLPDGTIIDGNPGDPLPSPGTRIRFRLPSDFYSASTWNAQRASNLTNLTTRNITWGSAASQLGKIYSALIDGSTYDIYGSLHSNLPSYKFEKSGSFYNCSGAQNDQTCTYGGGAACATFKVPRSSVSYTYTVYSQYQSSNKPEGSRNGSITRTPSTGDMTFFFNTNTCVSFKKCSDGLDNDGDGKIDMLDPGCAGPDDDNEAPQCSDTIDNDADGLVDTADPGCHQGNDLTKPFDPNDDDEVNPVVIAAPTITGSTIGKPNNQYAFTAQSPAFGVVDTQYQYGFDWNPEDGLEFVDYWTSPPIQEGQPGSAVFSWISEGAKTFKVKTRDSNDIESTWASHTITLSNTQDCSTDAGKNFWTGCPVSCGGGTEIQVTVNADCSITPTGNTQNCNMQACDTDIIEVPVGP